MKRRFSVILVLVLASAVALTQEKAIDPSLIALAESERAFARHSVEHGMREAFITYFADDGIAFQPHPQRTREALRAQAPPPSPPSTVLNWAPIYGDIARSGELGYTTGPFTVEDRSPQRRPTSHGMYFSVWKKQGDGSWRVVLDIGIQTPAAVAPLDAPFRAAPASRVRQSRAIDPAIERERLLARERELMAAANARGFGPALEEALGDEPRIHRPGHLPFIGREAISAYLAAQTAQATGEPIYADVARSGELGYAYGRYETSGGEKGYYGRVWKRDQAGRWRVVADIASPLPPERK